MEQSIFHRAELLLGTEALNRIASKRVIVFGVGGVGSWCAEGLVRTGIQRLTIVDSDCVTMTNINRQLMATTLTLGEDKVAVLKERLTAINPKAEITAMKKVFCDETASDFSLGDYDYIVDAIDSLKDKALLILLACRTQARLFSSMGAARKIDPTRIRTAEFWKVEGDPLARALRHRFKRQMQFPERKFQCVFSDELLQNKPTEDTDNANGSLVHITAVFGFTLASLVLRDAAAEATACTQGSEA